MLILREKCVKHIYLIVFILIQIIGLNSVQAFDCIQCGGTGADCKNDRSDKPSSCPTDQTYTKCFTQIDSKGKIERGCLKDETTCTSDKNCYSTAEKENNQLVCKTCSGTDADCSQSDATDIKFSKVCDAGISKCIKKIENKLVVRSCAKESDVTQCTDNKTCATCDDVNCNTGIFPENRLKCYQCSGEKCNDVTALTTKPCLLLQDNDQCYTNGANDTTMTRGCKSDQNPNPCATDAGGCKFCSESACNKRKYTEKPKCYQCTGDSKSKACFGTQTDTTLKECQQDVLYSADQYCFTKLDGDKIERGCLNDKTDMSADKCKDPEGGNCSKCTSDGCNGQSSDFTCIICRSDVDEKCWNNADQLAKNVPCRSLNNTSENGCFQGIWHGVAVRGCTLDADPQVQYLCSVKNNPNNCNICHEKNCNNKKSSAAKNSLSFVLMSFVLITLWKY